MVESFFDDMQEKSDAKLLEDQKQRLQAENNGGSEAAAGFSSATTQQLLPSDDADVALRERMRIRYCWGMVAGIILLGGGVVSFLEGWTIISGIFWAFQTVTTVGYGDGSILENHLTVIFAVSTHGK